MNELTINYAQSLDLTNIHNAALLKESQALADITNRFNGLVETTAATVESLRREQAPILYRIKATKLYEKDGFKSMQEYCKGIGLSASGVSGLTTAGKVYTDKNAPDALKALSVSKLAQMGALLNDKDMCKAVYEDAKNGILDGKTLAEVKDYVTDVKGRCGKVKPEVVKMYTAIENGKPVTLVIRADGDSEHYDFDRGTVEEWLNTIKLEDGNAVKVPDIGGHKAIIGYDENSAHIYILTEYVAPKADTGLKADTITRIKILTRKIHRGEDLTESEYELAYSLGLIDDDEADEDEGN